MSQPSSSMISADNSEAKYKKALKEISKLISANRVLRETNEKSASQLKQKINQLSLRYEDLQKQYDTVRKEKQSLTRYLDQLEKERNNYQRQIAYLNDVLAEQNAELKKFNQHKDQRAVAALIRTYEEKQASMNRSISQSQQMIKKLKLTVERLEGQVQHQRNFKQEQQQRYRALELDMNKYKQQNIGLHEQIQRLLRQGDSKGNYTIQKQRQLRSLTQQLQKQIGSLKTYQDQSSKAPGGPTQSYQQLLTQKNKISIEFAKIQAAYQQQLLKQRDYFEMEQKMKTAKLLAERANQQVNMLKSKIVVLEAKEFLEEAGDDDYDQKFFEERLTLLMTQSDPLNSIKNYEDSSHFRILKSFIIDLQDKIYKINSEKKEVSKKYKSLKVKFVKNAQQLSQFESQNKILRGKLQGYQRLTQKLQFQLQRAISSHQDEITRMTITSNNIITKKVDQYKTTINFLNSQLEMNQDKSSRTEKNYKQEIQTLKLELDTLKIKFRDETDKSGKDNQLIEIYKRKNNQISNRINSLEDQLAQSNQNLTKFQHLFKQQKGKNQGLLSQKQQLIAQNRQLTEQIDKKVASFHGTSKVKQDQYEFQIKRLRSDNQRLKDEVEQYSKQAKNLQKQLDDIRRGDQTQVAEIRRLTQRNTEVQGKVSELRRRVRDLEEENQTLKVRGKKFEENYNKINKFEEDNISKNDRINDLVRQKITLQNQLKTLQGHLNEQTKINQQLKKDLAGFRIQSLQSTHENKREFETKIFENKKVIQSLNQEISDLTTQLKQQKSKNLRLTNQINTVKQDRNRIQQQIQQNRKKDFQNQSQFGNIRIQLSNAQMQIQKLRSDIRNYQSMSNNLNQQVETLQQKIFSLNQQISNLKMKLQSAEDLKSDLIRDLNALKFNLGSAQTHASKSRSNPNLAWDQQNFFNNLTDIFTKIKRICRNYGINIESTTTTNTINYQSSYQPTGYTTTNTVIKTTVVADQKPKGGNDYYSFFKTYAGQQQSSNQPNTLAFKSQVSNQNNGISREISKVEYNQSSARRQVKPEGNGYLEYFNSYAAPNTQTGQYGQSGSQGYVNSSGNGNGSGLSYLNKYNGTQQNNNISSYSGSNWNASYSANQAEYDIGS